jgi:hypothetical protein
VITIGIDFSRFPIVYDKIFLSFFVSLVFKLSKEIFDNNLFGLISVFLIEAIYFYNFTTPEFNVNVCQLPFWSLTVYFSWKIYSSKEIKFTDCFFVGLFAAFGFLSKCSNKPTKKQSVNFISLLE